MTNDTNDWSRQFNVDIQFGYVGQLELGGRSTAIPRQYNPRLVLNHDGGTVEHAIVEELRRCERFTFSVAFVSPSAIAQLKQKFLEFGGTGRIVTADFLGFNQPRAFAELLKLRDLTGIEVRRHTAKGFHPKGYVFEQPRSITALVGSSNLTSSALSQNHEWNLQVSAAHGSDLATQFENLLDDQMRFSEPITEEWIEEYAARYVAPAPKRIVPATPEALPVGAITPNAMQQDALLAISLTRAEGARRAIVVSATGTGKTILSAFDVKSVNPRRSLFLVHREQILDRTIEAYRRVLGGNASDFGKVAGGVNQIDRRYVFATVQSLSRPEVLAQLKPDEFDYVLIDEAHRAGAPTYQRLLNHFTPQFLLGMTATPERTDGFNVFELFDYNVPYEIRLNDALNAEMLTPFHYYGISDVTYEDGSTTSEESDLQLLITPERVDHLIHALDTYGQAGEEPRGLIFGSRTDEVRELSRALNERTLRGRRLRTVALTGDDPVTVREARVAELESGQLDYILTVDVFNEGVDIPTVNQIVMLRQTQSAIIFVQQLGRGLRLAEGKNHLVVIDFIGNYTNNFLIPIALFGDNSLNRESLRERLNETIESGSLPGLSSVSFDEISRQRVLKSIEETTLDSMARLKSALQTMQFRLGRAPRLLDFHHFESVDPTVLATKKEHFPALVQSLLRIDHGLSDQATRALGLLSHEVLPAKRLHEFVLLEGLLTNHEVGVDELQSMLESHGLPATAEDVRTTIETFTLEGYSQADIRRYRHGVAAVHDAVVRLTDHMSQALHAQPVLAEAVRDLLDTGKALTTKRYEAGVPFTPGMQYTRRDAARVLGWGRKSASTVYGYKTDTARGVTAIFVTLHKHDDVSASTAYDDALLDPQTMRWFSKSNRTMKSKDVRPIIAGDVALHVFVKKDDADGSDHYYLGSATAHDPIETTMSGDNGRPLSVVTMTLKFDKPVPQGLFDYFRIDG